MSRYCLVLLLSLTTLTACGDEAPSTSGPVTITSGIDIVGGLETTTIPDDRPPPRVYGIEADGSFTEYEVNLAGDGSFRVTNAPDGEYTVVHGSDGFVTNARTLDLGFARLGRRDCVAHSSATALTEIVTP